MTIPVLAAAAMKTIATSDKGTSTDLPQSPSTGTPSSSDNGASPSVSNQSSSSKLRLILGVVFGIAVLLLIGALVGWYILRRKMRNPQVKVITDLKLEMTSWVFVVEIVVPGCLTVPSVVRVIVVSRIAVNVVVSI